MTAIDNARADFRLPTTSVPRRYELRLAPNLDESRFDGEEHIEIEVVEPTDELVLNALDLEIISAALGAGWASAGDTPGDGVELAATLEEEREMVVLRAAAPVASGRYTLHCRFSGILNDKLCGFYRSTFVDDGGVDRTLATTQFEETDARRAFPCYDEPEMKAVFSVTLDVPDELFAVSNGPELATEALGGGIRRVRFGETIAMSTYLVAFIVGNLEATDPIDVDGVALRVVHVPGKAYLTAAALDCGAHALRFYAGYFGIPYPAEKLDLVAIPDFAAGAMENLGCVTFREAILLAEQDNTSRAELERLAEVVEHEIAHMWFGDLVTMRWWNGIWLNEAFATFMALCCQDDYRPEWQTFVGFSRDKAGALGVDALHATRPIEFPVNRPEEAAAMFDVLTYEKGASVLWMLESYLGRDRFRAGVRRYLAAHEYANTETTDLWDAIEAEAGDEPIRELMDSWIFQGGYPLVSASRREAADGNAVIELSQQPFSYLPASDAGPEGSAIGHDWIVPLIARPVAGGAAATKVLLRGAPEQLFANGGQLVLNAGGAGFYRVHHDRALLDEVLSGLGELAPSERYNLVSDTWASTLAGLGELGEFLRVVRGLGDERDPNVWSIVIGALGTLGLVAPDADQAALAEFTVRLLAPVFAEVGWEAVPGEDEQVPLLRSALIAALGNLAEDDAVIAHARELFAADAEGTAMPADLATAVLAVVVAHATPQDLDAVLERYRHPRNPMDEVRNLYSLGGLRDIALARTVQELCRGEVRSQNAPYLLGALLRSREVGPSTFEFINTHFDELEKRFPDNSIHRMLDGVTGLAELDAAGDPVYLDAAASFLRAHVPGARVRLVEQTIERLRVNVRLAQTVRAGLGEILAAG
jgi:puromycin-sensitive aminopeptidase